MISRRQMVRNFVAELGKVPTGKLVQALAAELVASKRTHQIDLVMADIAAELYESRGELHATATSAHGLTDGIERELTSWIKNRTKASSVTLRTVTDKSLLGGLIIETPTERYDWSARGKLEKLGAE
jgi:F0F1-type ATP synthase delta subunit